jgi:hypothetical protein
VIKAVRGTAEGRQVSPLGGASALIAACSCMLCICSSEDAHSLSACGEIVAYAPAAPMFDKRWALRLSRGSPRGLVFLPIAPALRSHRARSTEYCRFTFTP